MPDDRRSVRLAYLTGVYPLASHTFIQREIDALRADGMEIATVSIRRPDAIEIIGPEEEAAQSETYYVLAAARNPLTLLAAHATLIAKSPRRWLKSLWLALQTHRPGLKGWIWQIFYFLEAGLVARHVQKSGITHIHNHFADSSASVAMLTAEMTGLTFSFTMHGPTEFFAPESWHLGEKVARASLVVCISHFARSQVMLFSDPAHWHKLRIVHCGVIPDRYDTSSEAARAAETNFLFVGRLAPVKGLRVLFEAFEAARVRDSGISLTVIGDGPDRAWVDQKARELGGVEVLGYQSQQEVAAALSRTDVLVLPSFAEGVPVALMEAMASRRPVIATRVGGVSELVENGVSGLLVAPGNADALADALVEMSRSATRRESMGAAGRAKVCAEFDLQSEAAWLKTLFAGEGGDALRPETHDQDG